MKHKRNRPFYLIMICIVICLGLLSRRITVYIPDIIDLYLGDSLWALMIYLLISINIKYEQQNTALFLL